MSNSIPLKGDSDKRIGAQFAPLSVSAQEVPNLTVKIRAGSFWNVNGDLIEFPGGNTPVISVPSTLSRWALVCLNESGSITITYGANSSTPSIPTVPAGSLALAAISMASTTVSITSAMIQDVRPFMQVVENVPDFATQLGDRPTFTDVDNMLVTKADIDGTPSLSFTLNKNGSGASTTAVLVNRGASLDVGVRWNEMLTRWEFTNDGSTWVPIASTASASMPLVPGAVVGNVATFNSSGAVQDSGSAISAFVTSSALTPKANKVVGATAGHFATLNVSGDLLDSGVALADLVTQTDLDTKANDVDVVHLTGAEVVGGAKTFTSDVTIQPVGSLALSVRSGAADAGLVVDRVGNDARFEWDESSQSWQAGVIGSMGSLVTAAPAAAHTFYAGPTTGGPSAPAFRALVTSDLPAINFPVTSVAGKTGDVLLVVGDVTGAGTVSSVSVTTANGVSGVVATSTTTPAITLTLGAITPTSVAASGSVSGSNLSGTNTGDQTITLSGDVTGTGTGTFATTLAASGVTSGAYGSNVSVPTFTVDAKGRITTASSVAINFPVLSVNGQTGVVALTNTDVGAAPVVHSHISTDITDFTSAVDGRISAAVGSTVQGFDLFLQSLALIPVGGIVVRAGATAQTVTVTGTVDQIAVANGSGTGGNPTISLADNVMLPGEYVVSPSGAVDPVGAPAGAIYFNTTSSKHRAFDGTVWNDMY